MFGLWQDSFRNFQRAFKTRQQMIERRCKPSRFPIPRTRCRCAQVAHACSRLNYRVAGALEGRRKRGNPIYPRLMAILGAISEVPGDHQATHRVADEVDRMAFAVLRLLSSEQPSPINDFVDEIHEIRLDLLKWQSPIVGKWKDRHRALTALAQPLPQFIDQLTSKIWPTVILPAVLPRSWGYPDTRTSVRSPCAARALRLTRSARTKRPRVAISTSLSDSWL